MVQKNAINSVSTLRGPIGGRSEIILAESSVVEEAPLNVNSEMKSVDSLMQTYETDKEDESPMKSPQSPHMHS